MNPQNELDEETVAVDTVEKFKWNFNTIQSNDYALIQSYKELIWTVIIRIFLPSKLAYTNTQNSATPSPPLQT